MGIKSYKPSKIIFYTLLSNLASGLAIFCGIYYYISIETIAIDNIFHPFTRKALYLSDQQVDRSIAPL
jgi:hypothetical protein